MEMHLFHSDCNLNDGKAKIHRFELLSFSSLVFSIFLLTVGAPSLYSQSSENYDIEQSTFNSGGNPSPILSSLNYRMTLDSVGEGIVAVGVGSDSYEMETGFPSLYPPPGEVLNLLFTDKITLTWDAERSACGYYLYRGELVDLPFSYGSIVKPLITETYTTDEETPAPGGSFFFLLTAVNRIGEEGPKGSNSSGTPRL